MRVISERKYLLSLRRDDKFKSIEDFIGLEWGDNVIDSIPWWKDFKIAYKKKFSKMVSELGSDFFLNYKIPYRYIRTMVIYGLNHLVMMERSLNFMMYYQVLLDGNSIALLMMIMATELIIRYNIGYGLF